MRIGLGEHMIEEREGELQGITSHREIILIQVQQLCQPIIVLDCIALVVKIIVISTPGIGIEDSLFVQVCTGTSDHAKKITVIYLSADNNISLIDYYD